jgi:phenylacetic acid degradation operon negative regulatory protein
MQARSMLFTLFGDYVRHYGGTVWVGSLIGLMAELGFSAPAVRAAVSRMARQGWLAPLRSGRASYYALTPRGQARIDEAAHRIFKLHPDDWDGRWRVLVVGGPVPRAAREALRRELAWMGFARLSGSVYLAPTDLRAGLAVLEARYGSAGRLALDLLTGEHVAGADDREWAARHWDLPAIDRAYARFLDEWRPRLASLRERARAGALSDAACFVEKTQLVHAFRKFLFVDPGLPRELLPTPWAGTEARAVFSGAYHLLSEGALRVFEHHYRPAPGREGDLAQGRQAARRDPFRPPVPAV